MDNSQINPNRFLRYWMLNSVLIWPVAAIVCIFALVPFVMIFSLVSGKFGGISTPFAISIGWIVTTLVMIILSTLVGYVVGEKQERLVDSHLHWMLSDWTRWSMFGGAIGGLVIVCKSYVLDPFVNEQILLMLNMPLFVLCLSIAQWQVLQQSARDSWLWILGNLVGGIVFSGVLFLNQPTPTHPLYIWATIGLWVFATIAQGAITGIIMLWLYDRPLSEWNDQDAEVVPVYVEVRTRSDKTE